MPSLERKSYIIAVASLLVGVASMVFAYQSIQVSKQLAEASGSLDRSSMEVGLEGHPLTSGKENYIVVGAASVTSAGIPVVGAIPFTFRSTGKKSLDSILISFQYHELFQRNVLELAESRITGAFSSTELKKSSSAEENRFFVSYSLPAMNPGVALRIAEPLFLRETRIRDSVPVTTKDGVSMTIPYEASYSKKFGLVVSARDSQILGYPVSVSVQKASSIQDLTKGQLSSHIRSRQKQIRKDLGAFAYLTALLTSSPSETAFLVFVELNKVTAGGATVYSPTQKQEVAVVQYPLIGWSLLMGDRK
jgi:hypothetical protein